jgi:hypothetical protein
MPITSFIANFLICKDSTSCYTGNHLIVFSFVIVGLGINLFLLVFSSSMLTTCYPHENIPWAHFPSNVPFLKLAIRIPIVLVYQLDTKKSSLISLNAIFCLIFCIFIFQRLTKAMTYDPQIHFLNLIQESILIVLFLGAFLSDLITNIP